MQLVNPDTSNALLEQTMRRVGTTLLPVTFIEVVSNVYHAVDVARYADTMFQDFKAWNGDGLFKECLGIVKARGSSPTRLLNIGCGAGYDLKMIADVFEPHDLEHIVATDISAAMLAYAKQSATPFATTFSVGTWPDEAPSEQFGIIVTHSLVHHIAELAPFFAKLSAYLKPGGYYVMAHEPNRRFWNNRECLAAMMGMVQDHQQRNQQNEHYIAEQAKNVAHLQEVNRRLRSEYGFRDDLSMREIRKIVDVHVPNITPGEFQIGANGLDWEEIRDTWLPQMTIEHIHTFAYAGLLKDEDLSEFWLQQAHQLAEKYPLDGVGFNVVFRKAAG